MVALRDFQVWMLLKCHEGDEPQAHIACSGADFVRWTPELMGLSGWWVDGFGVVTSRCSVGHRLADGWGML